MSKQTTPMFGLLEYLSTNSGCAYLSDLRQQPCLGGVQQLLPEITPSAYSIWEWNDAVSYITGMKLCFDTQEQAAEFLKNYEPKKR